VQFTDERPRLVERGVALVNVQLLVVHQRFLNR
jgi:hypothetical protein